MKKQRRSDRANQLAEEYAPMPAENASMSGVVGGAVVALLIAAFAGFYFINLPRHWILVLVLVACGFVIPFSISVLQKRRHLRAAAAELNRLEDTLANKPDGARQ
jgi:energy-converting hydrogenase Eha subunit G